MSNSNSLEVYEPAINNSEDVVKRTSETINVIKNETILLKDKQKNHVFLFCPLKYSNSQVV